MADFDLVVTGNLVTEEGVERDAFVAVRDGKVAATGKGPAPAARDGVLDARGCWILPGVVDGQVHTGSQANREGLGLGTRAAAAGGVTTIVDMPYDEPQPVVNAELFRQKVATVGREAHVDVALYGTMAKENGVGELRAQIEAGACGFKFSTYESHPTRFPRIAPQDMLEAFALVAPTGLACGVHNEDQEVVDSLSKRLRAEGRTDWRSHGLSRPPVAELLAIAQVYEIGAATGCRAHIVHCSVSRGFILCEAYRQQGVKASIETCVHYLVFNEEDLARLGPRLKVNPPIRPKDQVEALWGHVAAGRVDFVSSDHVAWSLDRKANDQDFFRNSSGVPGLETLLPAFFTGVERRGLPLTLVPKLLSGGAARHFCLAEKGRLAPGADADFVVLEPGRFKYSVKNAQGAAEWSPFDGMEFSVRVRETFVRGRQVWDGVAGKVTAAAGQGRFVPATLPGKDAR